MFHVQTINGAINFTGLTWNISVYSQYWEYHSKYLQYNATFIQYERFIRNISNLKPMYVWFSCFIKNIYNGKTIFDNIGISLEIFPV